MTSLVVRGLFVMMTAIASLWSDGHAQGSLVDEFVAAGDAEARAALIVAHAGELSPDLFRAIVAKGLDAPRCAP